MEFIQFEHRQRTLELTGILCSKLDANILLSEIREDYNEWLRLMKLWEEHDAIF